MLCSPHSPPSTGRDSPSSPLPPHDPTTLPIHNILISAVAFVPYSGAVIVSKPSYWARGLFWKELSHSGPGPWGDTQWCGRRTSLSFLSDWPAAFLAFTPRHTHVRKSGKGYRKTWGFTFVLTVPRTKCLTLPKNEPHWGSYSAFREH